jgi:hypothetical protein
MVTIKNRSNFSKKERVTELSPSELSYMYRSRDSAGGDSPNIGNYQAMGRTIFTKRIVVKAIEERDIYKIRGISKHFFATSGIYARACKYLAFLPTYDYMLIPHAEDRTLDRNDVYREFMKTLNYIDSMNLVTRLAEISLAVIVEGAYYGYLRTYNGKSVIQDLPIDYCRSVYRVNGMPVVEFDLNYFDRVFQSATTRSSVVKTMPREIYDAYERHKRGEDVATSRDGGTWITLDTTKAIKFSLNKDDSPLFSSAIPRIIDLDDLEAIQKKKAESQLLKILIQKIPLDKNGEFIFDMEEAKAMHANAVRMLARAINIDVLTTFADAEMIDLEERRTAAATEAEKWERSTYNDLGISQQLFATEGNLALEKSVANDESLILQLVNQYSDWLNFIIQLRYATVNKNYFFKLWFPRLTQHNRAEMSKLYKEQAALGYSKTLPALALGQSQSNFLAASLFESEVLDLGEFMDPVKMASTQSGKQAGRPEKSDDQKSDKTLANEASGG